MILHTYYSLTYNNTILYIKLKNLNYFKSARKFFLKFMHKMIYKYNYYTYNAK